MESVQGRKRSYVQDILVDYLSVIKSLLRSKDSKSVINVYGSTELGQAMRSTLSAHLGETLICRMEQEQRFQIEL